VLACNLSLPLVDRISYSFSSSQLSPESPPRNVPPRMDSCKLALSPILSSGSEHLQHQTPSDSSPEQVESRTAETSPGSLGNTRPHSLNLSSPERAPPTTDTSPGSLTTSRPPSLPSPQRYSLMSGEPSPVRAPSSPHRHGVYEIISGDSSPSRPTSITLTSPHKPDLIDSSPSQAVSIASPRNPDLISRDSTPTYPDPQTQTCPQTPTYTVPQGLPSPQKPDLISEVSMRPTSLGVAERQILVDISPTQQGLQVPLSPQRLSPVRAPSQGSLSPHRSDVYDIISGESSPSRPPSVGSLSPPRSGQGSPTRVNQVILDSRESISSLSPPRSGQHSPTRVSQVILDSRESIGSLSSPRSGQCSPTRVGQVRLDSRESIGSLSPPRSGQCSPTRVGQVRLDSGESSPIARPQLSPQRQDNSQETPEDVKQRDSSRPTSTAATSPLNSRGTSVSAAVSSLGSLSRPTSLSLSSPEHSESTKSSPISPEQASKY
jgi:hypothetical protein